MEETSVQQPPDSAGPPPRVSIGLPVYNGELYIAEAIECFLAQTFPDFELVISDNASHDRTQEICQAYAARDSRVRYFRNETNLGAARNFNRAFERSSGEYFKWAAHDDLCEPEFLAECVAVLDGDPGVVLCYPRARVTDVHGAVLLSYVSTMTRAGSDRPSERLGSVVRDLPRCSEVFGLIRASVMRQTSLIGPYVGSDRIFLAELALRGRFHELSQFLFLNRDHPLRSVRSIARDRDRSVWFDPSLDGRIAFVTWKYLERYAAAVQSSQLALRERVGCYRELAAWIRETWLVLVVDLASGVKHNVLRVLRRQRRPSCDPQ